MSYKYDFEIDTRIHYIHHACHEHKILLGKHNINKTPLTSTRKVHDMYDVANPLINDCGNGKPH